MLKDVREKAKNLSARPVLGQLMHVAVALMLCVGLLLPLLSTLGLPYSTTRVVLLCAGLLTVLQALQLNRWARRIGVPLLLGAGVFALINQSALMSNLSALASLLMQGQGLGLALFSGPLVVMLAVLFACICHALVHQQAGFYMAMLLTVGVLLTLWFYGDRSVLMLCLPALAALGILYAAASDAATPYARSLPMALIAILLASLLLPATKVSSPQMEEGAGRVRDLIYDYFFFTDARSVYSLTTEGYQPLGQDRLGGPVTLSDQPVMQVRTAKPLLLRGTVKDYYTGLVFIDNASSRRYLSLDPRYQTLKQTLFDMQRPTQNLRAGSPLFDEREIEIELLAPGVSTIFLPQRFESISTGEGMVPYFNSTSETFITRDTAPGDRYTVIGYPFTAADPGVESLVTESAGYADAAYAEEVRKQYLQLPESVESQVYGLAEQVTQGHATNFQKAQAIERYLEETYPYTLDQNVPTTHRDFVSWFLLEERQGYCTSFAAAMTIMARCVGIPARYIEGYLAAPGDDGIARVTGEDAHAWVEIYFDGFGWVPFDPTPGSGSSGGGGGSVEETPEDAPPMGDMDDPPPEEDPDSTPTPTPSPTPEPTPTPTPTPTPNPDDDEDPLDPPAETPTPSPTPPPPESDPPPTPPPTPPPEDDEDDQPPRWPWLVGILSLLLLGTGVFLRLRFTNPAFVAGRQPESGKKILVWYRAIQRALQACGMPPKPLESPLKAFEDAERQLGAKGVLLPVAITVCYVRYGGKEEVTDAALRDAQASYVALKNRMTLRQKLKHLWIRLRYGLGNLKTIP